MSTKTGIEWADWTWGIFVGCKDKSSGCLNCYAKNSVWRLAHNPNPKIGPLYIGLVEKSPSGMLRWTGVVRFLEQRLFDPFTWKKARKVFVNSQSDMFHEHVADADIDKVFAVMALCPRHTFQILTKWPERMAVYFAPSWRVMAIQSQALNMLDELVDRRYVGHPDAALIDIEQLTLPLKNVWLGTSVENQACADERIPHLLKTPAAVRFLSCEPLLGAVDLPLWRCLNCRAYMPGELVNNGKDWGCKKCGCFLTRLCPLRTPGPALNSDCGLHWVIAGGESGPKARPMHADWARGLRDQCQAAGVPFFFKQWGEWIHESQGPDALESTVNFNGDWKMKRPTQLEDGSYVYRQGKHWTGREIDGRTWEEFPKAVMANG